MSWTTQFLQDRSSELEIRHGLLEDRKILLNFFFFQDACRNIFSDLLNVIIQRFLDFWSFFYKKLLRIIRIMSFATMRVLLCVFVCEISKGGPPCPQLITGAKYFLESGSESMFSLCHFSYSF